MLEQNKMQPGKIELLAPAGDFERLEFAVKYGADAVYLGGKSFGLRAAAGFDFDGLKNAVSFAHNNNIKVYFTCNTLPRNDEIDTLPEFLINAEKTGIDAVILSDIGVLSLAKRYIPDVEIHISTQAGIVNYAAAEELYKMGAKRIVLARELTLDEIKRIKDKTSENLELEAFVHGAMCVSFSGRCLISSYLTGRDANRGDCAQPCRWGYHLMEEKRGGEFFKIFEDEKGTYILNSKDLCMISHIDKLYEAGITSFKIEGRAKSFYYTAVITNAYRMAIDSYIKSLNSSKDWTIEPWIAEETEKVSHRRYTTGFFFGSPEMPPPGEQPKPEGKSGQFYENGGYVREYDVVAVVDKCEAENGALKIYITQRNKFCREDLLELIAPGIKPVYLRDFSIQTLDGELIESAPHPMMKLMIKTKAEIANKFPEEAIIPGAIIRIFK